MELIGFGARAGAEENMTRTVRNPTAEVEQAAPPESAWAVAMRMKRVIIETRSNKEGECCICCTGLQERSVAHLPCGHSLHTKCYRALKGSGCASSGRCPMCRAPFLQSLPRWERGGVLRGILRMRLEEEQQWMDEGEEEPEGEEDEGETESEEEEEDPEMLLLIRVPLPTAEQDAALIRHLTRRQGVPGWRWAQDPGAWADEELGLAALFGSSMSLEDAPAQAPQAQLVSAANPLAVADGQEWEEEQSRTEGLD